VELRPSFLAGFCRIARPASLRSSRSESFPCSAQSGAVDYSHANAARASMQAALDAAALMLSKEALNGSGAQFGTRGAITSMPISCARTCRISRSRSQHPQIPVVRP